MTVKIVTDSVADLPPQVIIELGISIVPLNVRFGTEVYRDGIDLTADEFYERIKRSEALPVTSVPSPASFTEVYDKLAGETDEILVLTLTSRLSGTHEVAKQSVGFMKKKCRIEVIDTKSAAMALGLLVITAARMAQAGAGFDEIRDNVYENIPRAEMRATFDTLEYLQRGGRIGKAQSLMGSILKINPIIGLQDGEVVPISRERSRARAIEFLYRFAGSYRKIDEMAIEYAEAVDDAEMLMEKLGSIFPKEKIYRSKASPVVGTHTGPGILVLSILGDK
jgi:DegV family protein with EDD domain